MHGIYSMEPIQWNNRNSVDKTIITTELIEMIIYKSVNGTDWKGNEWMQNNQ